MNKLRTICLSLILVCVLEIPTFACTVTAQNKVDIPSVSSKKADTGTIHIDNIAPQGDTLYGNVLIIARTTVKYEKLTLMVDGLNETWQDMTPVGLKKATKEYLYQCKWDSTSFEDGEHVLVALVWDSPAKIRILDGDWVQAQVVHSVQHTLNYEIDYLRGYYPSTQALDYVQNYWLQHGIQFNYRIDDEVVDPTPNQLSKTRNPYISESDYWVIEKQYNDGSDNSINGEKYTSNEKWVLWGNWALSLNNTGYCKYVNDEGGNYIFIAENAITLIAQTKNVGTIAVEALTVAHEMGHSIGIWKLDAKGEVYDPNPFSVMSLVNKYNVSPTGSWYYSGTYWAEANLNYY